MTVQPRPNPDEDPVVIPDSEANRKAAVRQDDNADAPADAHLVPPVVDVRTTEPIKTKNDGSPQ